MARQQTAPAVHLASERRVDQDQDQAPDPALAQDLALFPAPSPWVTSIRTLTRILGAGWLPLATAVQTPVLSVNPDKASQARPWVSSQETTCTVVPTARSRIRVSPNPGEDLDSQWARLTL